jgi:hypothetical protein
MSSTILEVLLGAIIAILTTILIENLRKPKLVLRIAPPKDMTYPNSPANEARFLGLELHNKPLPKWARWMSRDTALQCHGYITFHHLDDGQNVFDRKMRIRWSGSPEPTPIKIVLGNQNQIGMILDPSRLTLESRMDVLPGESERLDVVARFDNDAECFGWNNASYFSNPLWRNAKWRLKSGRYLVRVTVVSAGEKCTETFRLLNDVPRQDFRLTDTLSGDTVHS